MARRLAFLEAQIEAGDIEYEQAQAHIDDCLALAGDCHAIYMSIDDSLRRIANQAFFDRLIVLPEDGVIGEPGEPFDALFNPDVQTRAVHFTERTAESGPQTADVGGLNNDQLVDAMERYGNRRRVIESLVAAWSRDIGGDCTPVGAVVSADREVIPEPRRRSRTPLTEKEVDAMRTARAKGISVSTITRQFDAHRSTVWEKIR